MSLAEASGLVNRCSRLFKPFFRWAYPHLEDEDEIIGLLGSNFIANFIGLGSLAMLSGIKAFKALDQINKNKQEASRFMKTLIIFNTTGCSLFPMSIISIRSHFHSQNPLGFIGYTLLIGVMTLCCGIFIQKGVERFGK